MRSKNSGWTRVRDVVAAFVGLTGLFTLAMAGIGSWPETATPSSTQWVPPSMHVAEAGVDVGPGSDEALLVTSPVAP